MILAVGAGAQFLRTEVSGGRQGIATQILAASKTVEGCGMGYRCLDPQRVCNAET